MTGVGHEVRKPFPDRTVDQEGAVTCEIIRDCTSFQTDIAKLTSTTVSGT